MGLLDVPLDGPDEAARCQLLINVTHARIRRDMARAHQADRDTGSVVASLGLSPCSSASAQTIDAFVESGWQDDASPLHDLLSLLDAEAPAADHAAARSKRIDQTMAAIRMDVAHRRRRMKIDPESMRAMVPPRSFRLADFASIAAMLLVGIGVLWPLLVSSREQTRTAMCAAGMQQAGLGFGLFANDHDGRLPATGIVDPQPQAGAMLPPLSQPWWTVGKPGVSHSANLFVIVRFGYTHLQATACPGNELAPTNIAPETLASMQDWNSRDQVSYAYQLFWGTPPRLGYHPDRIIVGDRSPIVDQALRGDPLDLRRNSSNHAHRGQNVLRQDSSVAYLHAPVLPNGDNIWLPAYLEAADQPVLQGTELPAHEADTFLGP